MHARWAAALASALVVALVAKRARGLPEAHQTGDDGLVVVDSAGVASVRHQLHWHVVRGPLTHIDLANAAPAADPDPIVPITAEDGRVLRGQAARRDPSTVRIVIAEANALMRGDFTFDMHWRVDLAATDALRQDGPTWRLTVSAPVAHDGFDNARTVVELPAAPNEPWPVVAETGVLDESAVVTLRRGPQRDVLELLRPHVSRGEAAVWTVRLDSRALAIATTPSARAPPEAIAAHEPARTPDIVLAGVAGALGMTLALLVIHKGRAFANACASRGVRARGLLPIPEGARAPIAGAGLAIGILFQLEGRATVGAACVSIAVLTTALRASRTAPPVRGPGRWRTLPPGEVLTRPAASGHWLDVDSRRGRTAATFTMGLTLVAAILAHRFREDGAWLVGVDAAVLLPLFMTGRISQLPPSGIEEPARWLSRVFVLLPSMVNADITVLARMAPDGVSADELRLLVLPRMALGGVVAVEVGLAWNSTPVCWAATPEVLARVIEGSPAASRLAGDLPRMRTTLGRRPDERVFRLLPRNASPSGTIALVRGLVGTLTDRRAAPYGNEWTGPEKRAELSAVVIRSLAGLDRACLVRPCTL